MYSLLKSFKSCSSIGLEIVLGLIFKIVCSDTPIVGIKKNIARLKKSFFINIIFSSWWSLFKWTLKVLKIFRGFLMSYTVVRFLSQLVHQISIKFFKMKKIHILIKYKLNQ